MTVRVGAAGGTTIPPGSFVGQVVQWNGASYAPDLVFPHGPGGFDGALLEWIGGSWQPSPLGSTPTTGAILYYQAGVGWSVLPPGTLGQVLTSQGPGAAPQWV